MSLLSKPKISPLLAIFPLLLGGCAESPTGYVCTTDVVRGLEVRVEDAVTGAPIAEGATGWAEEGDFRGDLEVVGWEVLESGEQIATTLGGLEERAGTYEVHIRHEGYEPWDAEDVEITEGVCHVNTIELTAEMVPE